MLMATVMMMMMVVVMVKWSWCRPFRSRLTILREKFTSTWRESREKGGRAGEGDQL